MPDQATLITCSKIRQNYFQTHLWKFAENDSKANVRRCPHNVTHIVFKAEYETPWLECPSKYSEDIGTTSNLPLYTDDNGGCGIGDFEKEFDEQAKKSVAHVADRRISSLKDDWSKTERRQDESQ